MPRGAREAATSALVAFVVQLVLNLAWSPGVLRHARDHASRWPCSLALDVAVLVTSALFWRVRRLAAWLLVPYLAWVLFATVLNWQFLVLNPRADGGERLGRGAAHRVVALRGPGKRAHHSQPCKAKTPWSPTSSR